MPKKQFEEYRNYSVEVLWFSDGDIPRITGQPETVIVLTKSLILHGAVIAKRYIESGRLDDDILSMPTYQGLKATTEQLNILLDDSNKRESGLADQIERIKQTYHSEMDTLNKSQFKIRMLEEALEEGRERHSIERAKDRELLTMLEKAQAEMVEELNEQLDAANRQADLMGAQWEASKAHGKRFERRIDNLTDGDGNPLYYRERNILMEIVKMPWHKRVWAVWRVPSLQLLPPNPAGKR